MVSGSPFFCTLIFINKIFIQQKKKKKNARQIENYIYRNCPMRECQLALLFFFFFFKNIKYFNTHTGRGKRVLKKEIVICIQNDLTLGYTTQALNLYNSHSFSNLFYFRSIINFPTHSIHFS